MASVDDGFREDLDEMLPKSYEQRPDAKEFEALLEKHGKQKLFEYVGGYVGELEAADDVEAFERSRPPEDSRLVVQTIRRLSQLLALGELPAFREYLPRFVGEVLYRLLELRRDLRLETGHWAFERLSTAVVECLDRSQLRSHLLRSGEWPESFPAQTVAEALSEHLDRLNDADGTVQVEEEAKKAVRALGDFGLDDARVVELVDAGLDSPFEEVRARAAEVSREHGGTPRTSDRSLSNWNNCPLIGRNMKLLQELGASPVEMFEPEAPRPIEELGEGGCSPSDLDADISEVPPKVWFLVEYVEWPAEPFEYQVDEELTAEVTMWGPGRCEVEEFELDTGRSSVFYVTGHDDLQFLYGIRSTSMHGEELPELYRIDHDGSTVVRLGEGLYHALLDLSTDSHRNERAG